LAWAFQTKERKKERKKIDKYVVPLSLVRTWFVPLPMCDHSQGVYFPPNTGECSFSGFIPTNKQTNKYWQIERKKLIVGIS